MEVYQLWWRTRDIFHTETPREPKKVNCNLRGSNLRLQSQTQIITSGLN